MSLHEGMDMHLGCWYGGPGGHASRQWLSPITPVSSPPTVVTSPPSVILMSVPFSLRTIAIPVHMLITRPCTSPSQGVWLSTLTTTPPWLSRVQYARSLKKQSVASSPFLSILIPQCVVALSIIYSIDINILIYYLYLQSRYIVHTVFRHT